MQENISAFLERKEKVLTIIHFALESNGIKRPGAFGMALKYFKEHFPTDKEINELRIKAAAGTAVIGLDLSTDYY